MLRARLLRMHARARANPILQRLAVISRILLALAFIPTALVKLTGQRFTLISIENPVGFFFEALYRTGLYWRFIGFGQLAAGILVLIPRTSTLGAILFFPIVANIFVITLSMPFAGTPVVTGLMLLASFFLLCWDYDRIEALFFSAMRAEDRWGGPGTALERAGFTLGSAAGMVFFLSTRGFVPPAVGRWSLMIGFLAAAIVLVAWIRAARRRVPILAPETPREGLDGAA